MGLSRRIGAAAAAVGLACATVTVLAAPAYAVPTSLTAAPLAAPTGTPVTLAGGGCTGDATVTLTSFTVGSGASVEATLTVTPAGDGTWTTTVPMPARPVTVTAACDGATAVPVTLAPDDIEWGGLALSSVTSTSIVISTSPLVDGTVLTVLRDSPRAVLGTAVVTGGTGTVTLPRGVGPGTARILAVRQPDLSAPGVPVPIALTTDLPQPLVLTSTVAPRVSPPGTTTRVTGTGCTRVALRVTGQPAGWYDAPAVLVSRTVLATAGRWSTTFPMPATPATVTATCVDPGPRQEVSTFISPDRPGPLVVGTGRVGREMTVTVPGVAATPEAFTASGRPVAITTNPSGFGATFTFTPPDGTDRVVLVGLESLGENAGALQTERVQAWAVDVTGSTVAGGGELAPSGAASLLGLATTMLAGGIALVLSSYAGGRSRV